MRLGALVPALALGAALLTPAAAEADRHRSPDRRRHSGYDRSSRDHRRHYAPRAEPRGHYRPHVRHHYAPRYRHSPPYRRPYYRPYYRPHYRPHYWPYAPYGPYPPAYHAVPPVPYGYWPPVPPRPGLHGGVHLGVPGFGFSLYF